ncbi:unnamed protein product, partial [Rotaria sp. Silwood2]
HADKKAEKEAHPRTQSEKHNLNPSDDKDVASHQGHENQVQSFFFLSH